MPDFANRLRATLVAVAAVILAANLLAPAASAAPNEPPGIDAFLRGLGMVESSNRYDAVNPASGAYGKYQIMPFNWPVWAKRFLGDANALQTPQNQEKVARGEVIVLYRWLGSWPRVACWWLTGLTSPPEQWSTATRRYVDKVMTLAGGMDWTPAVAAAPKSTGSVSGPAPAPAKPAAPAHLGERDASITYSGRWGSASHAAYAGGMVAWATSARASASVAFSGRSIAWIGPVGPTRGAAQVWLDGKLVTTVSQYRRSYSPRQTIWSVDLGATGSHVLKIVVVGSGSHPMVAIDELVIGA